MYPISVTIFGRRSEFKTLTGRFLSKAGFIVRLSDLDRFDRHDELFESEPDVVIFDELFAESNASDILDICRRHRNMYFIFPSAYRDFELEQKIKYMGNARCILKPFGYNELKAVLISGVEDKLLNRGR